MVWTHDENGSRESAKKNITKRLTEKRPGRKTPKEMDRYGGQKQEMYLKTGGSVAETCNDRGT